MNLAARGSYESMNLPRRPLSERLDFSPAPGCCVWCGIDGVGKHARGADGQPCCALCFPDQPWTMEW